MKYLTANLIDQSDGLMNHYPDELKHINITIRGTRNLFDIYFNVDDIERSFKFTIGSSIECLWIINEKNKPNKYLSYPMLKKALFSIKDMNNLANVYLQWVDSLIFSSSRFKSSFKSETNNSHTEDETYSIYSSMSSLNDEVNESNEYMILSLKQKIETLEHSLQLKDKDVQILERDVKIRDKEIELLRLQISIINKSEWLE